MLCCSSSSSDIYQRQSPAAAISGEALKTRCYVRYLLMGFPFMQHFSTCLLLEINFTRQRTLSRAELLLNGSGRNISCYVRWGNCGELRPIVMMTFYSMTVFSLSVIPIHRYVIVLQQLLSRFPDDTFSVNIQFTGVCGLEMLQ